MGDFWQEKRLSEIAESLEFSMVAGRGLEPPTSGSMDVGNRLKSVIARRTAYFLCLFYPIFTTHHP